jgi:hypothetical protein
MTNDNVIITSYSQSRNTFHTDICRQVHIISCKKYVTESEARKMELKECAYCSGTYQHKSSGPSATVALLEELDPEEVDL